MVSIRYIAEHCLGITEEHGVGFYLVGNFVNSTHSLMNGIGRVLLNRSPSDTIKNITIRFFKGFPLYLIRYIQR